MSGGVSPTNRDAGPRTRVLVVEDSPEFRALIVPALHEAGFEVTEAEDGGRAVELARANAPDVIVLDLVLPVLDGLEVCRRVRTFSDAYVIVLTGRDDEVDKLIGFSVGADDYITKPVSPRELVARVRAMLRRPREAQAARGARTIGELTIDPGAREVRVRGERVDVTRTEFDLLDVLSESPRVVFGRLELLRRVWGAEWVGDAHVVDVHVSNLRRKIGDDPQSPRYVVTVRGVGYRMDDGR